MIIGKKKDKKPQEVSREREYKKPFVFKLSNYKTVDDIREKFGERVVQEAPRIKSDAKYAVYPGWTMRDMVRKFDGCLLIVIDGRYRFLLPSWRGYTMFENWRNYPSVRIAIFEGYWSII